MVHEYAQGMAAESFDSNTFPVNTGLKVSRVTLDRGQFLDVGIIVGVQQSMFKTLIEIPGVQYKAFIKDNPPKSRQSRRYGLK